MEPVSYSLKDVLVRQGIANGRGASRDIRGIGDGERSPAKGAPGHQTAEGGDRPIKGPAVSMPAKFQPRIIEGGSRYKGVSKAPLYLVQP